METNRRKVKLSGKKLRKIIIITVLVLAILAGAALYLRARVTREFASRGADEISRAQVTRGEISTSVYSSGRLSDDDVEKQVIPTGVELTEKRVSPGESVKKGDVIATVNLATVLSTMNDVTEEISSIDSQLTSASASTATGYINASVSGRVKKLYVASGDSVAAVMYEHGALALLSLDGYMAVDIAGAAVAVGDGISALTDSGMSAEGTVDAVLGDVATVLLPDSAVNYGEGVEVFSADGASLGKGTAYIHDELKIMGYTGTVAYVSAVENAAVYAGTTLMTLSDTATSGYATLLASRAELEDELEELIRIYNEGALCAAMDGTVLVINAQTADEIKESGEDDSGDERYVSISPDETMSLSVSVDESEILSVSVGQSASVSVDAIDDEVFTGEVTAIDRVGTSSSGVTVYTAEVSIPKGEGMLSGMSASATINIEGVENALLIPTDALNQTRESYYVYTDADTETGELRGMREVTVGISNSNYTEILTGLDEGDTVYYIEKDEGGFGFMMPDGGGGDFGGGMPGGDFGGGDRGGMPGGGGGMPGGGGGMPGRG